MVSLPPGTMMPYNAQATLHSYDALWGLLLPCTVHGRVTDIWRAYFTQRLLWDLGLRLAFAAPWVTQHRNVHTCAPHRPPTIARARPAAAPDAHPSLSGRRLLADFNSEVPLYQQSGALVDALLAWKPASPTLPGRLEELYVLMYELGIVERNDVLLAQAWIADLIAVGYRFPPLQGSKPVGKRNHLRKNGTAAATAATGRRGLAAAAAPPPPPVDWPPPISYDITPKEREAIRREFIRRGLKPPAA